LNPITALSGTGGLEDTPAGWDKYCEILKGIANSSGDELKEFHKQLRRGWCVGTELFKVEMKERMQSADVSPGAGPPRIITANAWYADQETQWETILQSIAKNNGVDLTALPEKKSALEKVKLAFKMRTTTSATMVWLARRLQMGEPGSLSQILHRYRDVLSRRPSVGVDAVSRVGT